MPANSPSQAPQTTNFVGLQDYLSANQPTVKRMDDALTNSATQDAQSSENESNAVANSIYGTAKAQGPSPTMDVTTTLGYGQAAKDQTAASDKLAGLSDAGTRSVQLQNLYGGYAPGDSSSPGLDSALAGAGGAAQFKAAQGQFAGLDSYLQDQAKSSQTRGYGDFPLPSNTAGAPTAPMPTPPIPGVTSFKIPAGPSSTGSPPTYIPGVTKPNYHGPSGGNTRTTNGNGGF